MSRRRRFPNLYSSVHLLRIIIVIIDEAMGKNAMGATEPKDIKKLRIQLYKTGQ